MIGTNHVTDVWQWVVAKKNHVKDVRVLQNGTLLNMLTSHNHFMFLHFAVHDIIYFTKKTLPGEIAFKL